MENIIFNELKVRGYNVDVGVVVMNDEGILVMSVYDFLLNPDSMEI